ARRPVLLLVAAVFLVVKTWLIPRVLRRMAAGAPLRPVRPGRSSGIPVLVAGGLVVVAYVIMLPVSGLASSALPTRGAIPLAFAMALIGLFVCVTGRDALGQVTGFLVFENAIFALGVVATYGMPGIVAVAALAAAEAPRYAREGSPRLFYPLFHLMVFTMLLAVSTDDVGVMWVAVEGTTLASVFLVNFERTRASLEAAYKYLLICS